MTMTTHLAEETEAAWSTDLLAPARLFGKSNAEGMSRWGRPKLPCGADGMLSRPGACRFSRRPILGPRRAGV